MDRSKTAWRGDQKATKKGRSWGLLNDRLHRRPSPRNRRSGWALVEFLACSDAGGQAACARGDGVARYVPPAAHAVKSARDETAIRRIRGRLVGRFARFRVSAIGAHCLTSSYGAGLLFGGDSWVMCRGETEIIMAIV